jgi:hypothetical protein
MLMSLSATIGQKIDETISQVQEKLQSVSSSIESCIPKVKTITKRPYILPLIILLMGPCMQRCQQSNSFLGDNPVSQGFREGASAAKSATSRVPVKKAPQKRPVSKPQGKAASSTKQKAVKVYLKSNEKRHKHSF